MIVDRDIFGRLEVVRRRCQLCHEAEATKRLHVKGAGVSGLCAECAERFTAGAALQDERGEQ